MIRKDLEARIRILEKLEGDKILMMKAENSRREQDYLDIVRLMQEDYEKFKNDNAKEFEVRDQLQKRLEDHISLLQRELILSQNIIKNPTIYSKVNENMVAVKTEEYRYVRHDPCSPERQHP